MSPIHDQTYRRYEGSRQALGRGWLVIAKQGIRSLLSRKGFIALQIAAWAPFVVRAVQMYLVIQFPQARQILPVDAKLFHDFVAQQGIFVFFVTIFAGAGLIANDRRANALQIYLSKPLGRVEYIGGKFAILSFFLLGVTLLPAVLLLLLQILFSGSFEFLRDNLFVVPAIVLSTLVQVIVCASTMLALSSLSKSSRFVAILFAGATFFTEAIYGVMRGITGSSRVAWVSIFGNVTQTIDAIFRRPLSYETPVVVCVLVLLGLVAISISVLERRVRGVEVVS